MEQTAKKAIVKKRAPLGGVLALKKVSDNSEIRSMATHECGLSRVTDDDLYPTRHLMSKNTDYH